MKIYKVKVNGKTYKVELESVEEIASTVAAAPAKEAKKDEKKAPAQTPVKAGEGNQITSPIQGTVIKVNVAPGKKVKKGDVVCVIEAMKLENDVVSPFDGEVSEVLISKGQAVASKQPIIVVK